MNKCYDMNDTLLQIGYLVSYVQNGDDEDEGPIVELLEDNKITIDGDCGLRTIDASDCYCIDTE